MKDRLIHKDFKFAGDLCSSNELLEKIKKDVNYHNFLQSWFNEKDFILAKTSGSTGQPKEIKLKKIDLISSSKLTADYFNLKPGDRVINCLPVEYIAGKMMLVRALVLGLDIYLFPVCSSPIEQIESKYDLIALTPMQLKKSINKISLIKNVLVGGSPVDENLKHKVLNINSNVFETYGMTETITHIAVKNISKGEKEFTALPGINVGEIDDCLIIKPAHLSVNFIKTNDLVELTGENKFIILGRKDFIINSAGVKINPETVERELSKQLNQEFIVSSINDDSFGEKVVLVLDKQPPENINDLLKVLGKYELPKQIILIEKFPKKNGKFDRLAIRRIINKN